MFTSAEKTTNVHLQRQQQQPGQSFFRKAGEESFFGSKESPSFFSSAIQAKLSVSSPDDPQEKEADAVAEQVMHMPDTVASIASNDEKDVQRKEEQEEQLQAKQEASVIRIQRKCTDCEKEETAQAKLFRMIQRSEETSSSVDHTNAATDTDYSIDRKELSVYHSDVIQRSGRGPPAGSIQGSFAQNLSSSKGAGTVLPSGTKQFMESRFGADFSGVRIHTGSYAENLSSTIHAQAFTHGNDIYFNAGKYSPNTSAGGTLLAHELTHTIQQGASHSHVPTTVATKSVARKQIIQRTISNSNSSINRSIISEAVLSGIDLSANPGGHQLDQGALDYLQGQLNVNLSDIRLHSDYEVQEACKHAGVNAFVQGRDIGIIPSKVDPETENGALLLSELVSKSLQQRGIKTTAADGNDGGGFSALLKQIKDAVLENKTEQSGTAKQIKADVDNKMQLVEPPVGKSKKTKGGSASSTKSKKGKGSKSALKDDGIIFKPVKRDSRKSPKVPAEDPAFLKVVSKTQKTAKAQKDHEPSDKKSIDAQNSAEAVTNEAEGKAKNRKTDGMGEASKKDQPFNAESFKRDLLKKIESITPKTLKEANDFKENNKIDNVKSALNEKVADEKENSTGPVSTAAAEPLIVNPEDNKQPVPLPPTTKGLRPSVDVKGAAPKMKMETEISMEEQSRSLDDEMKANNVSEEQLKNSNEPDFQQALNEKKSAQKDADEKPNEFRKDEKAIIKEAQTGAGEKSQQAMAQMFNSRSKNFDATVKQQQTTKQKDEEKRAEVTKSIEEKFKIAEEKVNIELAAAETESNRIFDDGAEQAKKQFEDYVAVRMAEYKRKRYSGFWGGLKWAKDKIFGMPDAVNAFYKDGRELYIKKMDEVITQVAEVVTKHLNEAKKAITDGKKSIDEYVSKLPKDLQSVGKEAAENIQDKFDSLEQTVNDKRNDLIDGLAKKYVDNVKQLDERIEELKEANKGLIDKAIGFLKKVWQVIKDLVNLFETILSRLSSIIGVILSSPGGFFDNLGKAFDQGFNNFKNKFTEYLEKGLMEWLGTNLGIKGFTIPEKFDASAFFSIALQVMGVTKERIRERAVNIVGERKVKLLEKAGGLLFRIYNEGLGVLWDMLIEKLSDFKDMVWEAIKSFIQKKIIEEAIKFVLSMLNPIGAFIKVCMAIYNFLMTLVRFKDRIVELLDTLLNAVMSIASGAVDSAAVAIERALAKSVSIIIAFLAAVLGLNDVAGKVKEIIIRLQNRVEKAIDWIITKANAIAGSVLDSALSVADKGKALVEKGKEKVVSVGTAAVHKVLSWLGIEKTFSTEDGSSHRIFISGSESRPVLMVASDPKPIKSFLDKFISQKKTPQQKKDAASDAKQYIENNIDPIIAKLKKEKDNTKKAELQQDLLKEFTVLADKIRLLIGRDPLNKVMEEHKYNLEGLAGTYGTMPKPSGDSFTADHQPQAAVIKYAADMDIFSGTEMEVRASGSHADAAYAINLHKIRHEAGRTYGNKGKATLADFVAKADPIVMSNKSDKTKRKEIVKLIKADKDRDVSEMRNIAKDRTFYSDIDALVMEDDQKDELIDTIKKQILAGENLISSQDIDNLVN